MFTPQKHFLVSSTRILVTKFLLYPLALMVDLKRAVGPMDQTQQGTIAIHSKIHTYHLVMTTLFTPVFIFKS